MGSDYKAPSPGWGKPYRTHKKAADRKTDPLPVALSQCPCPDFLHLVSSELRPPPLGCSQRPVGGVGTAARFCSTAGSIPEEGSGRWEWVQGAVRVQNSGPEFSEGVQGGFQGPDPGSVELGRAAQDEGSILVSLDASSASASSGASEREGSAWPAGLRLTGRSGWRPACLWWGRTSWLRQRGAAAAAGSENRCPAGRAPNE